jgi:hypothetical protein
VCQLYNRNATYNHLQLIEMHFAESGANWKKMKKKYYVSFTIYELLLNRGVITFSERENFTLYFLQFFTVAQTFRTLNVRNQVSYFHA